MKNINLIMSVLIFLTLTFYVSVTFLFETNSKSYQKENKLIKNTVSAYAMPISNEKEEKQEDVKAIVAPINDKEDSGKPNREVDNSKARSIGDAKKMYEASGTSFGVDVSKYQKKINWKQVKQSGVEFAMIRVGYRGNSTGKLMIDPYFEENIKGALSNGINVGVYFYSVAKNEFEAIEEAKLTIKLIKPYKITYPVAYDFEDFNKYRCAGVSNSQLSKNAVAFLNTIRSAGYTPMHYGSKNTFIKNWDMGALNNYKVWLAHYTPKTNYSGKYNMWQYTSSGRVSGINGSVDLNIAYFKYTSNENNKASNESEVVKDPNKEAISKIAFTSVNEQVISVFNTKLRMSPTTDLDNVIAQIKEGTEITRIGTSKDWSKVKYNNQEGYILNTDLKIKEEIKEEENELDSGDSGTS